MHIGVIGQAENGCHGLADGLLVLMPYRTLHGTASIWVKRPNLVLAVTVTDSGTDCPYFAHIRLESRIQNKIPIISQRLGFAIA